MSGWWRAATSHRSPSPPCYLERTTSSNHWRTRRCPPSAPPEGPTGATGDPELHHETRLDLGGAVALRELRAPSPLVSRYRNARRLLHKPLALGQPACQGMSVACQMGRAPTI